MFPTFRLAAPLPLNSRRTRPLFAEADVRHFVDTYEPPALLRDPFSQSLMTRPVTFRENNGQLLNVCVDESSMRMLAAPQSRAPSPAASAAQRQQMAGVRLHAHWPMQIQVMLFLEQATAQARARHGARHICTQTLDALFDAVVLRAGAPVSQLVAVVDQRTAIDEVVEATQRAIETARQLHIGIQRLMPRIEVPRERLVMLEGRRRLLLTQQRSLNRQVSVLFCRRRHLLPLMSYDLQTMSHLIGVQDDLLATTRHYQTLLRVSIPAAMRAQALLRIVHSPAAGAWRPPSPPPRNRP